MSEASSRSEVVEGRLYTGNSSQGFPARLIRQADRLALESDTTSQDLEWYEMRIAPRVGNAPRYVYLPDNQVFETPDNDGIDAIAGHFHQGLVARLVHRLENQLGLILFATAVTLLLTILTFTHGIPLAARTVAQALPPSTVTALSDGTMAQLDEFALEPSTLPEDRQRALREAFQPILATEPDYQFTVQFRHGFGANAFALPDGTLVFTDGIVELAESDQELITVLAHEMGHVVHRHGMQRIVQSSLSAWIMVLMTGDLSAVSDASVGLPAVLLNLAYSRDMEREADDYALQVIQENNLDPMDFVNLMTRLDNPFRESASHTRVNEPTEEDSGGLGQHLEGLFSTHPLTAERIERFRSATQP